ncbi:antirestriction protein ArdA [Laspinema sp. D1]|uniref:Antirestriction protein ArdA n=1 Tax=Laspinema palackyanum D2a TaxID=2953684 RepID=A0ABT2MW38_9CYAN|nr:antirestriction protein ArdA [Laspinema sp. D2a]
MKKKLKGLMVPDVKAAQEIAFALKSNSDSNAVILKTQDQRAIALAVDLAGVEETCKIGTRCRVAPPPLLTPMIYVACLAAYNAGILHGWWIDANQDEEDIKADIEEMLEDSPMDGAEEWAIHDFDNFGNLRIDEHESLETVARWGQLLGENPNEENALSHYIRYAKDKGIEPNNEDFQQRYCGFWENSEQFALKSEEVEELYQYEQFQKNNPFWSQYINWEYLGRDLELTDTFYYSEASSGIYVFREF